MATRKTRATETPTVQLKGQLNNGVKLMSEMGLGDLTDVVITSPQENEVLFFDGTDWVNKEIADVLKAHVWVLDGGDADGYDPEPVPPEPTFNNYAEEFTYVLYNYINGTEFQDYVASVSGLDSVSMKGSSITLEISNKFPSIIEKIFDDDEVSRMLGRVITVIYDNISGEARQIMDDVETDMWIVWKNQPNGSYNAKIFVYMSDSSVVFYDLKVNFATV